MGGSLSCQTEVTRETLPVPSLSAQKPFIRLLDLTCLPEWRQRSLSAKDVAYEPRSEANRTFIHATSDGAASFFVRYLAFDPARFPWLEWDWRVTCPVQGEDLTLKSGNDCSARLLVGFKGDWSEAGFFERRAIDREIEQTGHEPPGTLLVYVWASSAAEERILSDPHLGTRARVIVATAGQGKVGLWQYVRRNLEDDYRRAFGCEPPSVVSLSLLTDTDDTQSHAEADYGIIAVRAAHAELPAATSAKRALEEEPIPERRLWWPSGPFLAGAVGLLILALILIRRTRTHPR